MAAAAVEEAVAVAAAVTKTMGNNINRLLLQFHITGRCNLRCKHCYRTDGDTEPLSLDDVIAVIEQYKVLLEKYNRLHHVNYKGHINITGGEPFVRTDIRQILKYLGDNRRIFSYGILSNGSFIDEEIVSILKQTEVSFIQLSIDGDRDTHDDLRAKGDYDRVFRTAQYLEKAGIRTYISFTANKQNFQHIPKVAAECRKRRITKLWSDRLVPIGNGEDLAQLAITADIMPQYIKALKKAQGNILTKLLYPKTQVTMNRALQFIDSTGNLYSCGAGDCLITVDEFGKVMPCRRMPISCGNVFSSTLENIYFQNETFRMLRNSGIPNECLNCKYGNYCRGGAKCQSFAKYGTFDCADPACFLKIQK